MKYPVGCTQNAVPVAGPDGARTSTKATLGLTRLAISPRLKGSSAIVQEAVIGRKRRMNGQYCRITGPGRLHMKKSALHSIGRVRDLTIVHVKQCQTGR